MMDFIQPGVEQPFVVWAHNPGILGQGKNESIHPNVDDTTSASALIFPRPAALAWKFTTNGIWSKSCLLSALNTSCPTNKMWLAKRKLSSPR